MMDDLSNSLGPPPSQPWVVQNSRSSATPPESFHNPLPSFPRLSLGQSSCLNHPQAPSNYSASNVAALFSRHNNNHNMQCFNHVDQSMKQIFPDAHVSATIPASSQGATMSPCSLPLINEGMQLCSHQQIPLTSSPNSYQAATPPFQPPHAYQGQLNGPQSPPQNHLPVSPPFTGQCVNPTKEYPPAFDGENLGSSIGYNHKHASSISPIQHQPEWTVSTHFSGTTDNFPSRVPQDKNQTPQSPSSESRYGLDAELLPSAVKVMAEDQAEWEGKIFVSEPYSRLPPLATTSCVVEDRGNATPFAIRSTSYCVPCEGQMALLTHLPLGAVVTPLVKQSAQEKLLPVCKDTDCIVACGWCGASMCLAMSWQDCGQRFYCPFCGKLTEVPWQHYQPTKGVEGVRVDKDSRPELSLGSYEIVNSQKGECPALILAVDVSASSLRRGHLEFVTQQIRTLLASLNRDDGDTLPGVRVGLITYDSRIHLYDFSLRLSCPHMLVITETDDLQLPVREGLIVPIRDAIESIDRVLQLIPQFEAESEETISIELPIKAGLAVLQGSRCPGKLLIFHAADLIETGNTNPSSGFFGTNKPKSIFQPSEPAISLAKECISQGCGIHLFVLSHQDVGGAWPGHIPYLTGGALHTYSHLQGEPDRERFRADLQLIVQADTGYKAELKIFVSKDLRVSGCYGLFVPGPHPGRVTMATLDGKTTLAVELAHTRALDETRGPAIQVNLSYSNQTGERRSRIHTLTLRCSRQLQDTFRNYQAQTLLAFYCKKMYCAVLERPLQELREELQTEVTEALASYRKHCCSSSVSAGQLVLPQYLRALPVYINSLRKSEVLLPGLRSSVHQRLQQRCQVLGMDAHSTATHFYPVLLPLPQSVGSYSPSSPEEALRCSSVSLEPRGLYLLHTPLILLLWVGTQVPASTLIELFNISSFSSLPSGETKLPALENPLSTCVRSRISTLNSQAVCTRKLVVVKQGDTCEEALQRHLVEDKSPNGGASYADFLYHLHINSVRLLQ